MTKNPFKDSDSSIRIQQWNSLFPFDYLFRRKYKIPFGSDEHRKMSFFDMKYDLQEAKFMEYIISVKKYGEQYKGQLLKEKEGQIEMAKQMLKDEFDNLDLSEFDNIEI